LPSKKCANLFINKMTQVVPYLLELRDRYEQEKTFLKSPTYETENETAWD